MKIFSFKKAQGSGIMAHAPYLMAFAVAVGVVAIIIVHIGNVTIAQAGTIPAGIEDELILSSRFYNHGDCFAYTDRSGRAYPKVIDVDAFTQGRMDTCFLSTGAKYAYSLRLRVSGLPNMDPLYTLNWPDGELPHKGILEDVVAIQDGRRYNAKLEIGIRDAE